jgi:hypothetical protein
MRLYDNCLAATIPDGNIITAYLQIFTRMKPLKVNCCVLAPEWIASLSAFAGGDKNQLIQGLG